MKWESCVLTVKLSIKFNIMIKNESLNFGFIDKYKYFISYKLIAIIWHRIYDFYLKVVFQLYKGYIL